MSKLLMMIEEGQKRSPIVLNKAKSIAASLNSEVEVVRFLSRSCSDTVIEIASKSTNELVESVFDTSGSVTSQVVTTESIPNWLADHCNASDDYLVIKGGHCSEGLFHTHTDSELMHQLVCPLLISSDQKWKSLPNVLVCVDLSSDEAEHMELNERALQWAQQWQHISDYQLHAVYCLPIPSPLLAFNIVEQREYLRKHEPRAMEKLYALLNKLGMVDVTPHIQAGTPHKVIPHVANEIKADLVIMGNVGREGVQGFIKGNTAEKTIHHLRTDLLVIKPDMAH